MAAVNVQIFGIKKSNETRAAERFFKERRVPIQMVDLHQRPMAPAEIRRFADRFGLAGLLDTEGKSYVDAGLKYSACLTLTFCPASNGSRSYCACPWFAPAIG